MLTSFLFFIIVYISFIHIATSSQFYGGTISWRIQDSTIDNGTLAILITQTYIWTYSTMACDSNAIANHNSISASAGTLTCAPSCPIDFGNVSTLVYCVDGSSLNNISVGQNSTQVKIAENSSFSIIYQGTAWSGLSVSSNWSMLSYINLVPRSSNNTFNNAPIATVISPIYIQQNETTAIPISVYDADGDIIRCRWATKSGSGDECGTVCPPSSLPAGTILYPNCTVQITGTVFNSVYAIAVMAEDFISPTSTTPLSSVPVQFLVEVIAPRNCTPPDVSLGDSSCTALKVGDTYTDRLFAVNNCGPNVSITDIVTLSFPGMVTGSLIQVSSTTYYKSITWTPTAAQLGLQVMCAMAVDSNNLQSSQLCFTFGVAQNDTNACPKLVTGSTTTTISTLSFESISTEPPPSNCMSWPLFACLAGLVALVMLCNCCLLCHLYSICGNCYRRRSYKERSETTSTLESSRTASTLVPINRLFPSETNNSSRPVVQRISRNHLIETNRLNSSTAQSSYSVYNTKMKSLNNSLRSSSVPPFFSTTVNRIPRLPSENSKLSSISEKVHRNDGTNIRSPKIIFPKDTNRRNNKISLTTFLSEPLGSISEVNL